MRPTQGFVMEACLRATSGRLALEATAHRLVQGFWGRGLRVGAQAFYGRGVWFGDFGGGK